MPGAVHQQAACLAELTTAGTVGHGHTDPADWAGLTPACRRPRRRARRPDRRLLPRHLRHQHQPRLESRRPVRAPAARRLERRPGRLRLPGMREQYANDRAISDWVLSRGYAFAATDKGNTGAPSTATAATRRRDRRVEPPRHPAHRGRPRPSPHTTAAPPARTLAGISNGGYLVRWQLENRPELYDGGVDWEGTLWRRGAGPNLLTFLPPALRHYPAVRRGGRAAHGGDASRRGSRAARSSCGPTSTSTTGTSPSGSTARRPTPGSTGPRRPELPSAPRARPACDADYDYASRPDEVHRAVAKIGLTGRIGKPLITLHGTRDTLLPISKDSDVYARMVRDAGKESSSATTASRTATTSTRSPTPTPTNCVRSPRATAPRSGPWNVAGRRHAASGRPHGAPA